MQWLTYVATLLGLTFPLAIGFLVIGLIIVTLVVMGGEFYREKENQDRLNDNEHKARLKSPSRRSRDWLSGARGAK